MLPAIFAVLLLTNFVSAEIYVGQNPQNVNAVIKDGNGNLVPVTGVADEIVVVDLNYGGEGNTSGMSVDVSVSPVNSSSSGMSGSGYPVTYIGSPSSMSSPSSVGQIPYPPATPPSAIPYPPATPPSAMPVSLPSATSAPFSNPTMASLPGIVPGMSPTSPNMGTGQAIGLTGSESGSNPAAEFTGTSPTMPPSSPVSQFDNLVSGLNSKTGGSSSHSSGSSSSNGKTHDLSSQTGSKKNNALPNLFNPFGGKPKNPKPNNSKPNNPFGSFFIELGGSLGPVDDTENETVINQSNNTPGVATVPLTSTLVPGHSVDLTSISNLSTPANFSNVFPFQKHGKGKGKGKKKFSNPFFNTSNMLMNLSNPLLFNMSSMPTNFGSFANLTNALNSLFNGSSTKLQPFNSGSMPLTSLFNSFTSNMPSLTDMMNSFMNTNDSNTSPLIGMFDSFLNSSSAFNLSNLSSEFDSMMNSFLKNSPAMFNSSNGNLTQLTNMMNSILNTTSSMFSMGNSTESPIMDLMNSFLENPSAMFSSMGATESPFSNLLTMPSGESVPDEEVPFMNSMNGTSPLSSVMNSFMKMLSPTVGTSPITSAVNSLMNSSSSIFNFSSPFTSDGTTDLKNMFQSFLPSSLFGSSSDDEGFEDYPNDDIYQDLLTQPGSTSNDDEDYYNPLSSLLPPKVSAPSSFSDNGAGWTNFGNSGNASELLNGVVNMANNLLTSSSNGTIPLTGMLDSIFGINGAAPFTTNPLMPGGIFNPMTYVNESSPFNISSLALPASNWLNLISALNSTGLFGNLSGLSAVAQNLSSLTQGMNNMTNNVNSFGQIMSDLQSMWNESMSAVQSFMSNVASTPSLSNFISQYESLLPQSNTRPASHHKRKPLSAGLGSSFLAFPSSLPAPSTPQVDSMSMPDNMQASAPASEDSPVQNETLTSPSTPSSTPASPQPSADGQSTPTPTPPINANGTNPSSSSSGINLSSTGITLLGCLIVAFSMKNFLGLI